MKEASEELSEVIADKTCPNDVAMDVLKKLLEARYDLELRSLLIQDPDLDVLSDDKKRKIELWMEIKQKKIESKPKDAEVINTKEGRLWR